MSGKIREADAWAVVIPGNCLEGDSIHRNVHGIPAVVDKQLAKNLKNPAYLH